jgi:hypothetical protein
MSQAIALGRGGVLLRGCETREGRCKRIKTILEAINELQGSEGLRVIGLEYRVIPCDEHKTAVITLNSVAIRVEYLVTMSEMTMSSLKAMPRSSYWENSKKSFRHLRRSLIC